MRSFRRNAVIAIVLVVLTAACGGDDDNTETGKSDDTTSTSSDVTTTTVTAAAGATTTAAARAGATATTRAGATATTSKPTSPSGAPTPANPGTYDYAQSGSSSTGAVPPIGTLTIDPASAANTQQWHRRVDPSQAPNDLSYLFRTDGPFITDAVTRAQGLEIRCHFDAPVPAPPWPATVGKTITGHAVCGQITVDVTGSITELRKATVDGKSIDVVVIKTTLTTKGQVESTSNDVQWWAPSLRIPVHSESNTTGRFGAFTFRSNVISDLKSATPH